MKEKIFTPKVILFLIIFLFLAVSVTLIFVYYEKDDVAQNEQLDIKYDELEEKITVIDDTYVLKDLNGKYTTNNIEIKKVSYTEGEEFVISPYYSKFFPLEINYIQIDGLKDSKIEDKVNKLIKETIFDYSSKYTGDIIKTGCNVTGNFSNILSLSYYVDIRNKIDEGNYDYTSHSNGLNIDLTTGNVIELSECFAKGVSIKNIVSNVAYVSLAWDEKYLYGTWIEETDEIIRDDRSDLEDRVFNVVHDLEKGRYSYVIYPTFLSVTVNSEKWYSIYIALEDYYDKLTIFKKFLTDESIYTGEYNNENELYYGLSQYLALKIKEPVENLFICYDEKYMCYPDVYTQDFTEALNNRLEAEKNYAKANPDKKIFLAIEDEHSGDWQDKPSNYKLEIVRYELPEEYDEKYDLISYIRDDVHFWEMTDSFMEYFKPLAQKDKNIISTNLEVEIIYNYNTGEVYKRTDEIIHGSDVNLISQEQLIGLTDEELDRAYNEIFARHGHDFKTKALKEYFFGLLWYIPEAGKTVTLEELNEIERQNLQIIMEYKKNKT